MNEDTEAKVPTEATSEEQKSAKARKAKVVETTVDEPVVTVYVPA